MIYRTSERLLRQSFFGAVKYVLTNYIYSDKIYVVILCIQRGGLQNEN